MIQTDRSTDRSSGGVAMRTATARILRSRGAQAGIVAGTRRGPPSWCSLHFAFGTRGTERAAVDRLAGAAGKPHSEAAAVRLRQRAVAATRAVPIGSAVFPAHAHRASIPFSS